MAENFSKKLTLNSSFEEIERLEPYLEEIQQWAGFNDDEFARIRLVVSEAVTNAILHGNNQQPSKKVNISASKEEGILQVNVRDEGPGFDPASLPDPLAEENLLRESGRGIFLIKQYADEVRFSKQPATITMLFEFESVKNE